MSVRIAFVIGLMAFVLQDSRVQAADVPLAPRVPAQPYSWTGFYGGMHAGYGWGKKKFVDIFPTSDGEVDANQHVQGAVFGLQAGYNYQVGWLVLGVEGDFSWSDVGRNNFNCFTFGDQLCSAHAEWFGSAAGRVGITDGLSLPYIKGGAVWTHDRFGNVATCAGFQPTVRDGIAAACGDPFSGGQTRVGWLAGAGFEYRFARNWSAKLEYNYMDFGRRTVTFSDGDESFFTEQIHQKVQILKVGINYHLDWLTPPVTAPAATGVIFRKAPMLQSNADDEAPSSVQGYSGVDISKQSFSAYAGTMIAPYRDLDTSGLRLLLMGEGGTYKYPGDTGSIRGIYSGGDALAGYGFEGDNYSINLLAGISASTHMLSAIDPENRVQGTAIGFKVRGDAWVNPTPQTMSYGEAEYSTAFGAYYARAKVGYDFTGGKEVYFGPEAAAMGDERYNQWRVGAHVTQLTFGKIQVDISAGYAKDSVVGAGAYTNVGFSRNF